MNAASDLTQSAKNKMVDGLSGMGKSLQRSGSGNPINLSSINKSTKSDEWEVFLVSSCLPRLIQGLSRCVASKGKRNERINIQYAFTFAKNCNNKPSISISYIYAKIFTIAFVTFMLQVKKVTKKPRRWVSFLLKFKASRTQVNSLVFGFNIGLVYLMFTKPKTSSNSACALANPCLNFLTPKIYKAEIYLSLIVYKVRFAKLRPDVEI